MELIMVRKLAQDLERRNMLLPNQRGYRPEKGTWEYAAWFTYNDFMHIQGLQRIPNSGSNRQSRRWQQESAIQIANGTPHCMWRQFDIHKTIHCMTPGKKGWHAAGKLDFHTPAIDNVTSYRLSSVSSPLQFYTKGLADLNRCLHLQMTGQSTKQVIGIHKSVSTVQEQLEEVSKWCQEAGSKISLIKAQTLWCTLSNTTAGQGMSPVSLKKDVTECTNSLRHLRVHFDRMLR